MMDSLASLYTNRDYRNIQKLPFWICFFSFLLLIWASMCICQENALDLGRYYESIKDKTQTSSIEEIVTMRMFGTHKYDFLYHIILFVSIKLSIPLNFVTATIVSIYFYSICHLMFRISSRKIEYYILFVALLTTPLTWTVAISRNLTAIMFLTVAFISFLKKRKIFCLIFLIASIFTHFGSILYLIIFIFSLFLSKIKIKPYLVFLVLVISLTISFALPSSVRDFMVLFLDEENGYTHYFLDSGRFVFTSYSIRYGDKLPIAYALIYSIILLFFNKKQGYAFWLLLLNTLLFVFFLNLGLMFVNRIMLLMPLLWGLNISLIYKYSSMNNISSIKIISIIGLIPIILHFFAYRETYFPF